MKSIHASGVNIHTPRCDALLTAETSCYSDCNCREQRVYAAAFSSSGDSFSVVRVFKALIERKSKCRRNVDNLIILRNPTITSR